MSAPAATASASVTQKSAAAPALTAAPVASIQRQCECGQHTFGGECDDCKKKTAVLARSASGPFPPRGSFAGVRDLLHSPGQPLDRDTRGFMEQRFGHDFTAVRVHTSESAAAASQALHARAWALGQDVVFASGAYSPRTTTGRRLLAHELAHVVQQRHAPAPAAAEALEVSHPSDASEREAEAAADQVTSGEPVDVHPHSEPDVVHRLSDDAWKGIGIGGGILGLAGLIYLITRLDSSRVDNPPKCGDKQLGKIRPAVTKAIQWARAAAAKISAFQAQPAGAEGQYVRDRFLSRFRSDRAEVVQRVQRVTVQIADRLDSPHIRFECHTADSEPVCARAVAYVPGLKDVIVFCPKFYNDDTPEATVVHEMAHTLGAEITDRGYERERIFGGKNDATRMSTEAALGNAESYADFIGDLAEGQPFGKDPIRDEIDCPDAWLEDVRDAMALSQRATISVVSSITESSDRAGDWRLVWNQMHVPIPQPTVEVAFQAFKTVEDKLANPVNVSCKTKAGSTCDEGDTEWTSSTPPTFVLCPAWHGRTPDLRATSALSGLLGLFGGISQDDQRNGMARAAFEMLHARHPAPTREDLFGSPDWTPDLLSIALLVSNPIVPKTNYRESGIVHEKLSDDVPVLAGPDCGRNHIRFEFRTLFRVDAPLKGRAGPIPPLKGSIEYSLSDSQLKEKLEDSNLRSVSQGQPLRTPLSKAIKLGFDTDGLFDLTIRLEDTETGTVRVYRDQIEVRAVKHCPEQAPPAPANAPQKVGEE